MEQNKELETLISQAFFEEERDLSLPSNSFVCGMPWPKISREVRLKKEEVLSDRQFMARVPEKLTRHSKELILRKRVAEPEETISLLMNAMISV